MSEAFFLTTCVFSLAPLAAIWFGPMAALRRDNFRADIRKIRDELFDFMWQNGYSYEEQAYRDTRQVLNGMLRASNWLTPSRFFMGMFYLAWYKVESRERRIDYGRCPPQLKEALERASSAALERMIKFLYREGLFGLLLKCAVVAFNQSWRVHKVAGQLAGELYSLGGPAESLTVSQRSLLRC